MGSVKEWFNRMLAPELEERDKYTEPKDMDVDLPMDDYIVLPAPPEDVRLAAKTLLEWIDTKLDEQQEPEVIEITRDEWEGLQNELSFMKSQIVELEEKVSLSQVPMPDKTESELTLEGILEDLKRRDDAEGIVRPNLMEPEEPAWDDGWVWEEVGDDWGMDGPWEERAPRMVTLVDGPPGFEIGPFVLVTPEEREVDNENWKTINEYVGFLEDALDKEETLSGLNSNNSTSVVQKLQDELKRAEDRLANTITEAALVNDELTSQVGELTSRIASLTERNARQASELAALQVQHPTGIDTPAPLSRSQQEWERIVTEGPE